MDEPPWLVDGEPEWLAGITRVSGNSSWLSDQVIICYGPKLSGAADRYRIQQMKKAWQDPELRAAQSERIRQAYAAKSEADRIKHAKNRDQALQAYWSTPEAIAKHKERSKASWEGNDARRQAQSERSKAYWAARRAKASTSRTPE